MENGKSEAHKKLIGMECGRLTVLEPTFRKGKTYWVCQCNCGRQKTVRQDHLVRGETLSCGCYQKEKASEINRSHGKTRTRLYRIWKSMHARCKYENVPEYAFWWGRGITVCDEWSTFKPFYEWAMSNGYKENLSIDRRDNDGNYCPENCRWATKKKEQALNRRSNAFITYNGITKHISEWDKEIGSAKSGRVRARLNAGWNVEDAVTVKVWERRTGQRKL